MAFEWVYPHFGLMREEDGQFTFQLGKKNPEGFVGIAIFSTETLAQLAADAWGDNVELVGLNSDAARDDFIRTVSLTGGITHVAIDHDAGARAHWIRIEDI